MYLKMNTILIVVIIIVVLIIVVISQKNKKQLIETQKTEETLVPKNASIELCVFNEDCKSGVCYNGFCVEKPHDNIACVETGCENNIICLNNNILIYDNINKSFCLIYNWWNINKAYYMCEGIVPNTIFILSKNGIYINQYENNYDLAKVYLLGDNKIDDEVIKSIFVYKNVLYCICKGKIFYGLSQRELMNNAPINWELASYIAGRDVSDENVINVAVKGEMLDIETKKYHLRYFNKSWNKIDIKGRYIPISENRYLMLRKEKLYDYRHEDVIVYDKVLDAAYNFETKDILIITPYDVIKILPSNEIVTGKGNRLFNLHNKIFLLSNEECESL